MGNKIKVAHLVATNFFGGKEKQIVEHSRRIESGQFDFILISFIEKSKTNELLGKAETMSVPLKTLYTQNPFNPKVIFDLAAVLREEKIDILCTHGYKSNVIGRIASWITGIPEVALSLGWTGAGWKIKLYEMVDRCFFRLADHVVAVCEAQREKILKLGVNPDKVSVIHTAVHFDNVKSDSISSIRAELSVDSESILVVSGGRLGPEKNFASLIETAKMVYMKNKNITFVVFGEGSYRSDLESRIKDAGLQDKFFLPGFRKDFVHLLKEADVFVLPSLTEGFPNVILEAYALKKPVIATRVGGVSEAVKHNQTGFLVKPEETEKMAEYILRLARNPNLRKEMGERGYAYVKEHFNFDNQTKKFEDLYRKVGHDFNE